MSVTGFNNMQRVTRSDGYNLADLNNGFAGVVLSLISDEVWGGGCESSVEVEHRFEVEVADGVVVGWSAGRKRADAAVHFNSDEATGAEKPASDHKMLREVVVPVEGRAYCGGVEHGEADHAVGIQRDLRACQLEFGIGVPKVYGAEPAGRISM